MSACTTTVLRLIGIPSARDAAATSCAVLSNWASVNGSVPAPEHSIDSCTHSFGRLGHVLWGAGGGYSYAGRCGSEQHVAEVTGVRLLRCGN